MRIVYFGSGEFAVPSLRWLHNSPHPVLLVVTQPDRPAGRGKQLQPTPAARQAEQEGLEVLRCPDVNAAAFVERIRALEADLGVTAAFGQKLHEPIRSVFRFGCINLHASLLPRYRGAAPVARAILAGETLTGVSVFRMVDRMDAGPVLIRRQTMIGPSETCENLLARLAGIACDALGATMRLLEEDPHAPGEPQDESQACPAPKLSRADGLLRFDEPAEQLARRCRAMWPWPTARCRYVPRHGEPVEVALAEVAVVPAEVREPPGTLTDALTVAAACGTLEIYGIQPAGRRCMSWRDFVNGRNVRPGDRFESLNA